MNLHRASSWLMMALVLSGAIGACGGTQPPPPAAAAGLDAAEMLQGLIARAHRTVSQVGSLDSARRARSELERISEDYDDLLYQAELTTPAGRANLAHTAARALPDLRALAARVYEVPALDDVMGAALNRVAAQLELVTQLK